MCAAPLSIVRSTEKLITFLEPQGLEQQLAGRPVGLEGKGSRAWTNPFIEVFINQRTSDLQILLTWSELDLVFASSNKQRMA
jgi:hypothetical protein